MILWYDTMNDNTLIDVYTVYVIDNNPIDIPFTPIHQPYHLILSLI